MRSSIHKSNTLALEQRSRSRLFRAVAGQSNNGTLHNASILIDVKIQRKQGKFITLHIMQMPCNLYFTVSMSCKSIGRVGLLSEEGSVENAHIGGVLWAMQFGKFLLHALGCDAPLPVVLLPFETFKQFLLQRQECVFQNGLVRPVSPATRTWELCPWSPKTKHNFHKQYNTPTNLPFLFLSLWGKYCGK